MITNPEETLDNIFGEGRNINCSSPCFKISAGENTFVLMYAQTGSVMEGNFIDVKR